MNWDIFDFAIAAAMLAVLGIGLALVFRGSAHWASRLAGAGLLVVNLLLFWINGAVGIIGDAGNDANMLYLAVPLVGLGGAACQVFRGRGLGVACLASAAILIVVATITVLAGWGGEGPAWPWDVIVITLVFATLFAIMAGLNRFGLRAQSVSSLAR
ncbi:hypothetical protein [Maricaulis maris]|uniref:Uncharacterized protein n=1 Tax=Maricaulis maris (strain MCS10) TaxID=394221 RepID=Q0AK61_MARMM|nr:hypothetical protein [Maricaulis maris]ABI67332.1 conserved hypothetical protein [Maricaulis maris MCS10]